MKRSNLLIAGGILSIVAGGSAIIGSFVFGPLTPFLALLSPAEMTITPSVEGPTTAYFTSTDVSLPVATGNGLWLAVLPGMAIAGGVHALMGKRWRFALAGAICAFFANAVFSGILGLLAVIFIAVTRREFENEKEKNI